MIKIIEIADIRFNFNFESNFFAVYHNRLRLNYSSEPFCPFQLSFSFEQPPMAILGTKSVRIIVPYLG